MSNFLLMVVGWSIVLYGSWSIFRTGYDLGRKAEHDFRENWTPKRDGKPLPWTCQSCGVDFGLDCGECEAKFKRSPAYLDAQAEAVERLNNEEILTYADDSLQ